MRAPKIIGRIFLIIFIIIGFILGTTVYEGYKRRSSIKASNNNISIWHAERDEIYSIEQIGFSGVVTSLSPGLHRHDVDTLVLKIDSWTSADTSFKGNYFVKKLTDSTLLLFISYSESIWPPKQIDIGDKVRKEQYSYDFSIYNKDEQFKKSLSLLFCSYENPDTIIQKGNLIFGLYGDKMDTLFSGIMKDGKRNGIWRYYQAHTNNYQILEGQYQNNKRNGLFRKYYELTNQLIYEENYKDNLPDGQFIWWYSNGQVESKKYFARGKPIGLWTFYNDKGKLINTKNY